MKKFLLIGFALVLGLNSMAQYKLDTLNYAGDSKIFTDIVVLGDGFTKNEMNTFKYYVKDHINKFFNKTPFTQYQNMFNVFYVKTPSNESGAGDTPDKPIDNIFGSCFGMDGVDRMCAPTNWNNVYEVLFSTKPDYDLVIIMVNKKKYGGSGSSQFITYGIDDSSIEIIRHEAGHAFANLADEYWYKGYERPNMTKDINNLKWKNWVGEYGIGTYRYSDNPNEKGYSWYRPHQKCLMRYLDCEFCAVCREAIVERIHDNSKNIISYSPNSDDEQDIKDAPVTFSLNLLKPNPNTLRINWMIDGVEIAHNVDQISLESSKLQMGKHLLSVSVEDTTLFVRAAQHANLHTSIVNWNIQVSVNTGLEITSDATADFTIEALPFDDELIIRSIHQLQQSVAAELYDMNGRKVTKGTFNEANYCRLNTAQLPAGVYLLQIRQNNQSIYIRKILKR